MPRLRVGILDLVTKSPNPSIYGRVMNANLASIMPQAVGVWCRQAGHDVRFVCYTGLENLLEELPADLDLLFIGAFTQSAQLAYALSNLFRSRGAVTVLGGPHARCYPEDAVKYFDYVVGFTDKQVIKDVLDDCAQHRPIGRHLSAATQPAELPTLEERWEFVGATLEKAPTIKIVPMLGSLGCPYTCSFCIDSTVDYQPLGFQQLRDDLAFVRTKFKNPIIGWHDPNFGVRFDDYMEAIEAVVPQGGMRHIAESSLSLLSEPHLKRLRQNGFQAILPGIESWYDLGNKSKTRNTGMDKVRQVSDHVNMILRYIPYIQTNFVMGMDGDSGTEPFELTKKFLDLSPGAFPAYSLLSAFGRAAPMNLDYQRAGRVLPFPFHFLNNNHAMNVKPLHYTWPEFYDGLVDVSRYSFSWRAIARQDSGDTHLDSEVDERDSRGLVRGLRTHRLSHPNAQAARHRQECAGLHGRGVDRATGFLPEPDQVRARLTVPVAAGRCPDARSQRLPPQFRRRSPSSESPAPPPGTRRARSDGGSASQLSDESIGQSHFAAGRFAARSVPPEHHSRTINVERSPAEASAVSSSLQVEELRVEPAKLEQLLVAPFLEQSAVLEDQDPVRHPHRAEAVADEDRHTPHGELREALKHLVFRPRIQRRRWFIEDE